MALSELMGAGLFNEYRDEMIIQPLQTGYVGIGFALRLFSSSMYISKVRQRSQNEKFTKKMALHLYYYGYILGLIPIAISYPRVLDRMQTILNLLGNTSVKMGLWKVLVMILRKVQGNFLLLAILVPILGLINILILMIAEATGKSIQDLNEDKKKETWNIFNLVTTDEIIKRYRRSIRILAIKLSQTFPMISKFFRYIFNAVQSVINAFIKIKDKIAGRVKEANGETEKPLNEAIDLKTIFGGGFIIAIIVGLFKVTPLGGLAGLLIGLVATIAPDSMPFLKRMGPIYQIFITFRTAGLSLLKQLGLYEFLIKAKEFITSLQVVQTLQTSFFNVK